MQHPICKHANLFPSVILTKNKINKIKMSFHIFLFSHQYPDRIPHWVEGLINHFSKKHTCVIYHQLSVDFQTNRLWYEIYIYIWINFACTASVSCKYIIKIPEYEYSLILVTKLIKLLFQMTTFPYSNYNSDFNISKARHVI